MAYAAVVTISRRTERGRKLFIITVAETGGTATSEWDTGGLGTGVTVQGLYTGVPAPTLPRTWTTLQYTVVKASGDGATVAPVLARATGAVAAGSSDYLTGYSAATYVDDQSRVTRSTPNGSVYGRSNPASGTNNAINTTIVLMAGGV